MAYSGVWNLQFLSFLCLLDLWNCFFTFLLSVLWNLCQLFLSYFCLFELWNGFFVFSLSFVSLLWNLCQRFFSVLLLRMNLKFGLDSWKIVFLFSRINFFSSFLLFLSFLFVVSAVLAMLLESSRLFLLSLLPSFLRFQIIEILQKLSDWQEL